MSRRAGLLVYCIFLLILFQPESFSQNSLTFLKRFDQKHGSSSDSPPISYSALWGYVAPDGREYAIVGTYTGTAIIDITDTSAITEIAHIGGPSSIWREMRTYKERAYVVTEGGGGVQIIDLSNLPASASLVRSFNYVSGAKNTLRVHSIEIFDDYMYLNGCANWGTTAQRGALIFSLAVPDSPMFVSEYSPNYFHDSFVRNDTLFGASIYGSGGIYIANIKNKSAPVALGKISYTGSGTHNVWMTRGGKYLISTDEIGSTQKNLKIWDWRTIPTTPSATYAYSPSDIGHNVFVRGDYAFTAWYTAGIVVADVTNPLSPSLSGWYDSSTELPGNYDGVWAVYPYFWSGKVISGDMQNGLYIFQSSMFPARQKASLAEPSDLSTVSTNDPLTFQWTRSADPAIDPLRYALVLEGPSIDTTFTIDNDTSFTLSNSASLCAGTYSWYVVTKDEANEIASVDTFSFVRNNDLDLVTPDGAEVLKVGTTASITWTLTSCIDSVELSLSTDNGVSWNVLAHRAAAPSSYLWPVPNIETIEGLIRVRRLDDTTLADQSSTSFTMLLSPAVQLTSPNGNEFWDAGSVHSILWSSQAVTDVAIEYSTDGGSLWETIVASTPANTGSYNWTLPSIGANNVLVRISDASNPPLFDVGDASFVISIGPLNFSAAWNLVSLPVIPQSPLASENFVGASSSIFTYTGSYVSRDSVKEGVGYWVKYNSAASLEAQGVLVEEDTIPVNKRWNLIGTLGNPIAVSSVTVIPNTVSVSGFWAYRADSGYYQSDSLQPGRGYWVRATDDAEIVLSSSPANSPAAFIKRDPAKLNSLKFTDARGRTSTLFFDEHTTDNTEFDHYELPPVPPLGIFDVRYSTQRNVENAVARGGSVGIEIRSGEFPLTVRAQFNGGSSKQYSLVAQSADGTVKQYGLSASQVLVLKSLPPRMLSLSVQSNENIPSHFSLGNNYPNPFNPSTTIRYDLPSAGVVTLKVYDLLGREVAVLVNETKQPGSYSVQWDASGLPSGMYFYKLQSGAFSATKKLSLVK